MDIKSFRAIKLNLMSLPSRIVHLTPGIYADGYIVFAFPFVCSLVRNSGMLVEFMLKFLLKFLWWCISHEPMIRNLSYFNYRYFIGFALFL